MGLDVDMLSLAVEMVSFTVDILRRVGVAGLVSMRFSVSHEYIVIGRITGARRFAWWAR